MKSNSRSCTSAYGRRRQWSERNGQGQWFCPHLFHSAGNARTALGLDQCPAYQRPNSGSRHPDPIRACKAVLQRTAGGKAGAKAGAREPALAKLPKTSQVGTSLGLRSNRRSAFAERLQLCNVFATVVGCRGNRCRRAAARIWPSGAHAYPALGWAGHDGHQQDRL